MKNGNLASWSIEHKQIIYFFMFLCLVAGIYSYNILGRSEDPVYTVYIGCMARRNSQRNGNAGYR